LRILHISDVHCNLAMLEKLLRALPPAEYDVIALTGDVECDGEIADVLQASGKPTLFVPGNMDDVGVHKIYKSRGMSVDGDLKELSGYTFCGIGSLSFSSSLAIVTAKLEVAPEERRKSLVVLSHFPPLAEKTDVTYSGVHAGLKELRDFVERFSPLAFLHGHIHEAVGSEVIGSTLVVNAGPLRRGYYALVDLKSKSALHRRLT